MSCIAALLFEETSSSEDEQALFAFCGQNEVLMGFGFDLGAATANLELEGEFAP